MEKVGDRDVNPAAEESMRVYRPAPVRRDVHQESELTRLIEQQADTIDADNAWTAVLEFIRQQEGLIRSIWGLNGAVYQEFYPNGLEPFNSATKEDKDTLLLNYLTSVNKYAAQLGAQFVADYTTLKADLMFSSKQSEVARKVKPYGLKESLTPPYKIVVEKGEY